MDLVVLAVEVAGAGRQELAQHLERLVEAVARLGLVDAEARVLAPPEPATHAADDLAAGAEEGVEHVDVLGDPHRVVPGQHRDHRAQVDPLGDARDVGQVLQRVGHHGVGREVVLDRPDGVEAGGVGDPRDVELLAEDRAVGALGAGGHGLAALLRLVAIPVGVVLVEDRRAYAHGGSS